ncbi:MAG TPA: tetratricopeptide repeat protein [Anaerolineae bacterium]|nr:tetratricopeptide repeat protein [Anaerolineae bacterium]
MSNLIPRFILDKHLEDEHNGRFPAITLFGDISGFTTVTNTLATHGSDAVEVLADIMQTIFDPLVETIYGHGGFITTFAGDAFTAVFPFTHQLIPTHALSAATTIQQQIINHGQQKTAYGNFFFALKLGLGIGEIDWQIFYPPPGTTALATYCFSGPAIEMAAYAEQKAASGQLILSSTLLAHLSEHVHWLPLANDWAQFLRLTHTLPPASITPIPPPHTALPTFLPATIRQRQTYGEFRQVVSLFINLQQISDLPNLMPIIFNLQTQFGGYLNKVDFGDKGCYLLLFWGTPNSYENDLERALQFILALTRLTSITFKAGLTQSRAYTGLTGSSRRGEFTCYGYGVNMAARLMSNAPWKEIWLEENVVKRMPTKFVAEPIGEYTFKGFEQPQQIYLLIDETVVTRNYYTGTLVGRQTEFDQLKQFITPLLNNNTTHRFGGTLIIEGEAGIGKSRLISEFLRSQQAEIQYFRAQTDQTIQTPLNPFRYWLHIYFGQSPTWSEARNKQAFNHKLNNLIAQTTDQELREQLTYGRSFLGALLNIYWPNSPYSQLTPASRYEWRFISLKTLLLAESLQKPVVFWLEDIHWLDGESITFITRLVHNINKYPFAMMATSRPTADKQKLLWTAIAYQHLSLQSLPTHSLVKQATQILGQPLTANAVRLLEQRSEGNPFFVEQILFYLQEKGGLVQIDNIWHLSRQQDFLPDDIRTIFMARLDQLTEKVKEVVQYASVVGREFQIPILALMLKNDENLLYHIHLAEQASIWIPVTTAHYIFKHALLRDTVYKMQLQKRRRQLHHQAAVALTEFYTHDLTAYYGDIAYHYEQAYLLGATAVNQHAIDMLQAAGQIAANQYENETAINFFSRALAILPPNALTQQYQILFQREAIYHLIGNREAQAQDLTHLTNLLTSHQLPTEQTELLLRKTQMAMVIGNLDQAAQLAEQAAKLAKGTKNIAQEATAQMRWGEALIAQGQYDLANQQLQQSLTLAQLTESHPIAAEASRHLGFIARLQGDYPTTQQFYEQSLTIYRQINDRVGEGKALNNLSFIARRQGDYETAQSFYEQSLTICQEVGNRVGAAKALNNLGFTMQLQGNLDTAKIFYQLSLDINQEIGNRSGEGVVLYNLGYIAHLQADFQTAQTLHEQSLSVCQEIGDRHGQGYALTGVGDALYALGHIPEAQTKLQSAITLRQELGNQILTIESQAILAHTYHQQTDLTALQTVMNEIKAYWALKGNFDGAEYPTRLFLSCYQLLTAVNDPTAPTFLQKGYQQIMTQAHKFQDEQIRQAYCHNIPWHQQTITTYEKL